MAARRAPPPRGLDALDSDAPSVFDVVRRGDLLVHHPYESFGGTVGAFVQQAASIPTCSGSR